MLDALRAWQCGEPRILRRVVRRSPRCARRRVDHKPIAVDSHVTLEPSGDTIDVVKARIGAVDPTGIDDRSMLATIFLFLKASLMQLFRSM